MNVCFFPYIHTHSKREGEDWFSSYTLKSPPVKKVKPRLTDILESSAMLYTCDTAIISRNNCHAVIYSALINNL